MALSDILSEHNSDNGNVLLQHALLSALRNLSIPTQNKRRLIEDNLVEILYKMINSEQSPVVFKLLGTFRMVVDGQGKPNKAKAINFFFNTIKICRRNRVEVDTKKRIYRKTSILVLQLGSFRRTRRSPKTISMVNKKLPYLKTIFNSSFCTGQFKMFNRNDIIDARSHAKRSIISVKFNYNIEFK